MDRNIIAVLLCVVCIVALYFVQDKRARVAFGIGAVVAALFTRWKPKSKRQGLKPDTKRKERDTVDEEIDELFLEVDTAALAPPNANRDAVERLRARLKRRRERLHHARSDRAGD